MLMADALQQRVPDNPDRASVIRGNSQPRTPDQIRVMFHSGYKQT
jgi:hypothetical protein